ncbi:MAG: hypothetical protein KAR20_29990 [Candidatus Heimdallarchaeota archaeon]|nr:hypothetical protein [Candidatus Heimdallarchaeota archaeon]
MLFLASPNIFDKFEERASRLRQKQILVVAGTMREFDRFCQDEIEYAQTYSTYEYEGVEFVYFINMESMVGYCFSEIIYHGTYYKRNDVDRIMIRQLLATQHATVTFR